LVQITGSPPSTARIVLLDPSVMSVSRVRAPGTKIGDGLTPGLPTNTL